MAPLEHVHINVQVVRHPHTLDGNDEESHQSYKTMTIHVQHTQTHRHTHQSMSAKASLGPVCIQIHTMCCCFPRCTTKAFGAQKGSVQDGCRCIRLVARPNQHALCGRPRSWLLGHLRVPTNLCDTRLGNQQHATKSVKARKGPFRQVSGMYMSNVLQVVPGFQQPWFTQFRTLRKCKASGATLVGD